MEVINRTHEDITVKKKVLHPATIGFLNDRVIAISAGAARMFAITSSHYMHIVNDDERWLVYFNEDPDGFQLFEVLNKNSFRIFNRSLVHLFTKRTKNKWPCKFLLKETERKHAGLGLIEIMLSSRVK